MLHCIVSLINKYVLNKKERKKRKKEKKRTKERKERKEKKKKFVFVMYITLYCFFNK